MRTVFINCSHLFASNLYREDESQEQINSLNEDIFKIQNEYKMFVVLLSREIILYISEEAKCEIEIVI